MSIKNKALEITLNIIPIVLMIFLIMIFNNDYTLSLIYLLIIALAFSIKKRGWLLIFYIWINSYNNFRIFFYFHRSRNFYKK